MVIILADILDEQSNILYGLLKKNKIRSILIHPHDIKFFYMDNAYHSFIELQNGNMICNNSGFFINRAPDLPHHHPLVLFLCSIPLNKVLTHPITCSMILSKLNLLKYFKYHPDTTILKKIPFHKDRHVCIKSISQIRSMVRPSTDKNFIIHGNEFMPVQFQEIIYGDYIKVHMIGDDCFSYHCTSTTLDLRESNGCSELLAPKGCELLGSLELAKKQLTLLSSYGFLA